MVVSIAVVVSACSPAAAPSSSRGSPAAGLPASSSGACQALLALPDVSAAERAFTNVAHDALHRLAGDSRLDRTLSARVLEAMERVEVDFRQPPAPQVLHDHLAGLREAADAALQALGENVPPCAA